MTILPPRWDDKSFQRDVDLSTENFRLERVTEPIEAYNEFYDSARIAVENVLEQTVDLSTLRDEAPALLLDPESRTVLRYLSGPPTSEDDMATVAGTSISPAAIRKNVAIAVKVAEIILPALDRNRFPWISENREPTEAERKAAVVGTAAMMAYRKVMTDRAHAAKRAQERKVKDALLEIGFTEVPTRKVATLSRAPRPGEFCGEAEFGGRKADLIIGLWDERVMPMECKVSNSSLNSIKRLNNDTTSKSKTWTAEFGLAGVVPSAMLAGVFKVHSLKAAQAMGLTIWWSHDLDILTTWVDASR